MRSCEGRIDVAVHSAKDLTTDETPGLSLAAVLPRADARDAWCGPHTSLAAVPQGARVGTASMRRGAQLGALRPDLRVESLRGNVDTRLRKRSERGLDGVVLAACGLDRLELAHEIGFRIEVEEMLPETGQGFLALQARSEDAAALAVVGDGEAARILAAERACAALLGGGCRAPVATHARRAAGRRGSGCEPGSRCPTARSSSRPRAAGRSPWRSPARSPAPRSGAGARRSSRRCARDRLPRRRGAGRSAADHGARRGSPATRRRDRLRPPGGRRAARPRAPGLPADRRGQGAGRRHADPGRDDAAADRARPPRRARRAPQGRRPVRVRPRRRGGPGAARGRRRVRDRARRSHRRSRCPPTRACR